MAETPLAALVLLAAPVAAIAAGFALRRVKPAWTHLPPIASCVAVAWASLTLAAKTAGGWTLDTTLWTWMIAGDWSVPFGIRIDGLTAALLAMVSVVSGLIHVYAAGYMREDPAFPRFFLCFHFFFLAMVGLLIANNYVQLYLFWELVGAASYLLIGYWWEKGTARRAALQAFLTNRVGDFGLMLAVLLLVVHGDHGGARFATLFSGASIEQGTLAAIGFLILLGASAKSAQFPLYFWLPDAMEGPTPVSALMHAATMVTAGIFLLARSWPLIAGNEPLLETLVWIGGLTALGAALIAATKTDLKRILAYSTVSHLGLMAFALGLGQVPAAIFHLCMHGFFKAALFLTAGNIAHGIGRSTASVTETGGLARRLPLTLACYAVAALSLAGFWPFAGFYSKDAILDAAVHHGGAPLAIGLAISVLSAFYIFRLGFLAFLGPRPDQQGPGHPHEAPAVMWVPVALLAAGALGAGWLHHSFDRLLAVGWPQPGGPGTLPEMSLPVALMGSAGALLGAVLAWVLTTAKPRFDWQWRRERPALEAAFESDFGWRRVVDWVAAGTRRLADLLGRSWDERTWDAFVEVWPRLTDRIAAGAARWVTGSLNDYVWWMMAGAAVLLLAAVLR